MWTKQVALLAVVSLSATAAFAEEPSPPPENVASELRPLGPSPWPRSPAGALARRGDLWLMLRQYARALKSYEEALAKDPALPPEATIRRAFCLHQLKRTEEALPLLRALVDKRADFVPAHVAILDILIGKNDLPAAAAAAELARKGAPDAPALLLRDGRIARLRADAGGDGAEALRKQAVERLQALVKKAPPSSALGLEAARELSLARLGPSGPKLLEAKDLLVAGKGDLALARIDEVLAKAPDIAEAHHVRGLALASSKVNRVADAIDAFKKASTKESFVAAGQLFFEKGDMEEAEEWLKKALALDRGDQEAHYQLGLIYRELGEYPRAMTEWRSAMAAGPRTRLGQWASTKLQILTGEVGGLAEGEVLDPASERHLGQRFLEMVEKKWGFVQDEALTTRLTEIARKLVAVSDRSGEALRYEIRVANRPGINAVTFPGGKILFFRGMIDFVRKELGDRDDIYAAVLGHEIAHAALRHGVTKAKILSARASLTESNFSATSSIQNLMTGFSRANEFEADQYGALYTYRAGYNPAACIKLHETMLSKKEIPEGLGHPPHRERIARLREYLLDLRAKVRAFKLGLRAMKAQQHPRAIQHFEVFLGVFPLSAAGRNNLALAMHKKALVRLPATAYRKSADIDPDAKAPPIVLRAAVATVSKGVGSPSSRPAEPIIDRPLLREAIGELQLVLRNDPSYAPAHVNLAAALLDFGGDREGALRHLRSALHLDPKNALAKNNLAVAELEAGRAEEGMALLQELGAGDTPLQEAVYNVGIVHERAARKDDARKAFARYLQLDSTSGWARLARQKLDSLK